MRVQIKIYLTIAINLIIISCIGENTEDKTSQTKDFDEVASEIPSYDELELIELFRQTEKNGTILPEYGHAGISRFQITHATFDELLIEYSSTNIQIDGDSLASFIIRSTDIFLPEKRIVYDFGLLSGNYGDLEVSNASYKRQQLQDRWYFEEIGFD